MSQENTSKCWMKPGEYIQADSYTSSPAHINVGYIVCQGVNIQTVKCLLQKMKKFLCRVLYQQQPHITLFRWAEIFLVTLNMPRRFAQAVRQFEFIYGIQVDRNPYNKVETPESWQPVWLDCLL